MLCKSHSNWKNVLDYGPGISRLILGRLPVGDGDEPIITTLQEFYLITVPLVAHSTLLITSAIPSYLSIAWVREQINTNVRSFNA